MKVSPIQFTVEAGLLIPPKNTTQDLFMDLGPMLPLKILDICHMDITHDQIQFFRNQGEIDLNTGQWAQVNLRVQVFV